MNTRLSVKVIIGLAVIGLVGMPAYAKRKPSAEAGTDRSEGSVSKEMEVQIAARDKQPTFEKNAIVIVASAQLNAVLIGNGFVFGDGTLVATPWHIIADLSKEGDHVMLGRTTVVSRYYGDIFEAEIIMTDSEADLAILQVFWPGHPALQLATEQEVLNAEDAIVVGYPGIGEGKRQLTPQIDFEKLGIDAVEVRKNKTSIIRLHDAEKVGSGWSGAPIILPENGKVAGLFSSLLMRGERRQPVGCTAHVIRSLLEERKTIQFSGTKPELIHPRADSEAAFAAVLSTWRSFFEKDYENAIFKAQQFVKLRPNSAGGHRLLAGAASHARDNKLAEKHFQEALKLAPESSGTHFNYGIHLNGVGKKKEAVAEHRRALEIAPSNSAVIINLLNLLDDLNKTDEAGALGRRAVEAEPKNAYLWMNFATALNKKGSTGEAIQALTKAVTLKPEMGPMRGYLAHMLEKAGRIDEAEGHFEKLLEIEPTNPVVWFWYAKFLGAHRPGQRKEALEMLDKAVPLNERWRRIPPQQLERLRSQLEEVEK